MSIPQQIIDEIQDKTDIVELISSYLPLKKAGRNFKACCPFHTEKTPSFVVSPQKQIFHCFGCGAGGGSIQFVMQHEKVGFPEAVEMLAKKLSIAIPKTLSPQETFKENLWKLNHQAIELYEKNLWQTPEAHSALDYLQKRGLKPETIKEFHLGYASRTRDQLLQYMRRNNISISLLAQAGLITATQQGGYIDAFRERIIVPIFDMKNRAVGFGARRTANQESLPKYINTQETPVFTKRHNLFGLNFAKNSISEKDACIITEGYFDMIIPYQEGIQNIIASSGTALTTEQIQLVKRYTNNVFLVYDSDTAGEQASLRAIDLMIEQGLNVRVVSLPQGEDPASFVQKYGSEKFNTLLKEAPDFFLYKTVYLKKKYGTKDIQKKALIVNELLETLMKFPNEIVRYEYLRILAQSLSTSEDALKNELKKKRALFDERPLRVQEPRPSRFKEMKPLEKTILQAILSNSHFCSILAKRLSLDDFESLLAQEIFSAIIHYLNQNQGFELNRFLATITDQDKNDIITAILIDANELNEQELLESLKALERNRKKKIRHSLKKQIQEAEEIGNTQLLKDLINQYQELVKTKH